MASTCSTNRTGLTLMELLVSMALLTVVLGLGLQLYAQTQRVLDREQAKAARLGSEADLLSLLRSDVRSAAAVARASTTSRLILVSADGSRVEYRSTRRGVQRLANQAGALPTEIDGLKPRFAYPAVNGRSGRLVRVSWGDGPQSRYITLHLRNEETF